MNGAIRLGCAAAVSALLLIAENWNLATAQDMNRQFSETSAETIENAYSLADQDRFEAALGHLRGLVDVPELDAFERATIYQMIGQYSYELDRVYESQAAFEAALRHSDGLLPQEEANLKIVVAQLMIANGAYREGATRLEAYLASGGEVRVEYLDLLVNAWVQAEDYSRALPWAEKLSDDAKVIDRRHYDLLNFLYNSLGQQDDQLRIVKEMVHHWPEDKTLWDIWTSILANTGQDVEAFEVWRLMYQGGLLTEERDLLKLVQYHAYYDMPFQAAEILETEIAAGRISTTPETLIRLAKLFGAARVPERGLPYIETAARGSDDPDLHVTYSEALVEMGECEKADHVIQSAEAKGYEEAKALMLVGNCYVDQSVKAGRLGCDITDKEIAEAPVSVAIETFKSVSAESHFRRDADKWVTFLEADIKAFEGRCGHWHRPTDLCFQKIKQAYDAQLFVGAFELDDADVCLPYKAEYDANFR